MHIRLNDNVEIMAGADKGTRGRVLKILKEKRRVVVEGINRVYKHVRRSQRNPQGGRLSREMPVAWSNVVIVCESCGQAAKMGARFRADGTKERYCRKCGAATGDLAPARPAHAQGA